MNNGTGNLVREETDLTDISHDKLETGNSISIIIFSSLYYFLSSNPDIFPNYIYLCSSVLFPASFAPLLQLYEKRGKFQ